MPFAHSLLGRIKRKAEEPSKYPTTFRVFLSMAMDTDSCIHCAPEPEVHVWRRMHCVECIVHRNIFGEPQPIVGRKLALRPLMQKCIDDHLLAMQTVCTPNGVMEHFPDNLSSFISPYLGFDALIFSTVARKFSWKFGVAWCVACPRRLLWQFSFPRLRNTTGYARPGLGILGW